MASGIDFMAPFRGAETAMALNQQDIDRTRRRYEEDLRLQREAQKWELGLPALQDAADTTLATREGNTAFSKLYENVAAMTRAGVDPVQAWTQVANTQLENGSTPLSQAAFNSALTKNATVMMQALVNKGDRAGANAIAKAYGIVEPANTVGKDLLSNPAALQAQAATIGFNLDPTSGMWVNPKLGVSFTAYDLVNTLSQQNPVPGLGAYDQRVATKAQQDLAMGKLEELYAAKYGAGNGPMSTADAIKAAISGNTAPATAPTPTAPTPTAPTVAAYAKNEELVKGVLVSVPNTSTQELHNIQKAMDMPNLVATNPWLNDPRVKQAIRDALVSRTVRAQTSGGWR